MGLRVSEDFEIEDLAASEAEEAEAMDRLLEEALRNRPELRSAAERIESRRADVALADAGHLPVIAAGAEYGWADREFGEFRNEWTAGLGVTLPLFAGFGPSYRGGAARAELARAEAEREALARDVELEVWTEHARLGEARDAAEAARRLVESAEEGARAAEGRYRAGTGSIIELADSLRDRTAARARLVQAELDRASARVRFERALGRRSER
jgi:outer membrane protein TolC